jgi:hypothetical protein
MKRPLPIKLHFFFHFVKKIKGMVTMKVNERTKAGQALIATAKAMAQK